MWWRYWWCDLDGLNTFLFLPTQGATYEIWLQLAYWLLRKCLKLSKSKELRSLWVKHWPTDLAVPSSKIFSAINWVPLHTAFHIHSLIVLIWLKYCWKGCKIANHPSIKGQTITLTFSTHNSSSTHQDNSNYHFKAKIFKTVLVFSNIWPCHKKVKVYPRTSFDKSW